MASFLSCHFHSYKATFQQWITSKLLQHSDTFPSYFLGVILLYHYYLSICRYSIDYANTDPNQKFAIDSGTGEVTVKNNLDREEQELHVVHILATDKG